MSHIVTDGETVFDVVARYYGTVEDMIPFLEDNNLTFNSQLYSGQVLQVGTTEANEIVTAIYEPKQIEINSNDPFLSGDYDENDYNKRDYR